MGGVESSGEIETAGVPGDVHGLVEWFDRERAAYRSGRYNEAQTRVDFINPLFALLGWDVENRRGLPVGWSRYISDAKTRTWQDLRRKLIFCNSAPIGAGCRF
jgi:hypothetical protein